MRTSALLPLVAALLAGLSTRPVRAALESGVYQTVPGATVREWGDRVPGGSRVMPWFATLTFELKAVEPSVVAEITNAVLEGGDPFPLTVRSSFGTPLTNGNYQFMGDYLQDLYPSGTQYLFDWTFAGTNNGEAVWNGIIGWAGGHAWYVVISNITLVPVARLEISQGTAGSVEVTWPTNFTYDVLEYATRLPATNWDLVTNAVSTVGSRFSVTLGTTAAQQYFRLRRP